MPSSQQHSGGGGEGKELPETQGGELAITFFEHFWPLPPFPWPWGFGGIGRRLLSLTEQKWTFETSTFPPSPSPPPTVVSCNFVGLVKKKVQQSFNALMPRHKKRENEKERGDGEGGDRNGFFWRLLCCCLLLLRVLAAPTLFSLCRVTRRSILLSVRRSLLLLPLSSP